MEKASTCAVGGNKTIQSMRAMHFPEFFFFFAHIVG